MGWIYTREAVGADVAGFFRKEFDGALDDGDTLTVKACQVVGNVAYLACERQAPDTGEAYIFALVCWLSRAGGLFGYKPMDEGTDPFVYDCPTSILDMLSPTDNDTALHWRATCRERIAERNVI